MCRLERPGVCERECFVCVREVGSKRERESERERERERARSRERESESERE